MLSTVTYNLKIAKVFGINISILLSYINSVQGYNNNTEAIISREEVLDKTGLEDKTQIESEFVLIKSGLISVKEFKNNSSKYYCKINRELLNKILVSDTPSKEISIDVAAQLVRSIKPKLDKKEIMKNNLKKKINVPDPVVQTYYIQWIDSVYENPKGYLTSGAVELAQKELNVFSKGSQDIQIEVLKIAIKGGWRDINWAINSYNEKFNSSSSKAPIHFNDYNSIKSSEENIGGEAF